jgi:hypothetical protein
VFPDDDMRCAIETCRSSECLSVNNFRLIYDIQLVHLLVCNTQWVVSSFVPERKETIAL